MIIAEKYDKIKHRAYYAIRTTEHIRIASARMAYIFLKGTALSGASIKIMNDTVSVRRCNGYDTEKIESLIRLQLEDIGMDVSALRGKRVALKPNLVVAQKTDIAACTSPAVVEAAARILVGAGAKVVIAESPGGPYTAAIMKHNYRINGIDTAAENSGAELNYDMGFRTLPSPKGRTSKNFNVINPIADADVIFNVCKLKTHTLTGMTCAVKNFFGVIPGTQKVEMHARFSNQQRFGSALIDLCEMICDHRPVVCICDAVVGMEGNGPSGGTPRDIGCLIASRSPFALDAVAEHIIAHDGEVPMVSEARRLGLCRPYYELEIVGDGADAFIVPDYKHSDAKRGRIFSILPPFLQPRPSVMRSMCVGCGRCAESCPAHTIEIKNGRAVIGRRDCIKCFCCQELCPKHAIEVKKNFIFKLAH